MKRLIAATAVASFALAPAIAFACEYNGASSASATVPAQLALAPAPVASKAPAPAAASTPAPKAVKQEQGKVKTPAPDTKLVVMTTN
jgi:hypothetical protein